MPDMIKSPADYPTIKNVESDIDSMGKGHAEPIDGKPVVLSIPLSDVKENRD